MTGTGTGRHRDASKTYETAQFSFVEDENSGDVLDWLAFAETRAERREERRRRFRNRLIALGVLLAVCVVTFGGYLLWRARSSGEEQDARPRATLLLQIRDAQGGAAASALLVYHREARQGFALYIPPHLLVDAPGQGRLQFRDTMSAIGPSLSRDALSDILGVPIGGSWVLDQASFASLVDRLGGVEAAVDQGRGEMPARRLTGAQAAAYATDAGEDPARQKARFQQVLDGVLRGLPGTADGVKTLINEAALGADATLPVDQLAAFLVGLRTSIDEQRFAVEALPVHTSGALDVERAGPLVHKLFGSSLKARQDSGPPRVAVRNGSGDPERAEAARIRLLNAGYRYIDAGQVEGQRFKKSVVQVGDDSPEAREEAVQVALTLGLPSSAVQVKPGEQTVASIVVILGKDFRGTP
ncbi:hypothetical protein C3Y87_00565 [Carbonactinospora thermoautotrophica]|uniref:LCP family protein n=1 Tax=Carbonactinospora thermoautotrophica TaxID=1469144 RepID=UPI002270420E|nr:LCP family protein [Carbonactinospora thermoautotrophica]MCX9189936.1 hypothetical protein [Carbonactinospora thermoautotrophica]